MSMGRWNYMLVCTPLQKLVVNVTNVSLCHFSPCTPKLDVTSLEFLMLLRKSLWDFAYGSQTPFSLPFLTRLGSLTTGRLLTGCQIWPIPTICPGLKSGSLPLRCTSTVDWYNLNLSLTGKHSNGASLFRSWHCGEKQCCFLSAVISCTLPSHVTSVCIPDWGRSLDIKLKTTFSKCYSHPLIFPFPKFLHVIL